MSVSTESLVRSAEALVVTLRGDQLVELVLQWSIDVEEQLGKAGFAAALAVQAVAKAELLKRLA